MDIINYDQFCHLQLRDFVPNKDHISALTDWEFMGAEWVGEAIGFTEWLQLANGSKERSISLDFNTLSDDTIDKILSTLKLAVAKGMTKENIVDLLGEPKNILRFVQDRVTYEYVIGSKEKYYLSLTITNHSGLAYVVIMNHQETIKNLEEDGET